MPRTAAQNEVIKDKRRRLLLLSSLRVFAKKGLDKATIDDITLESESSHGLFYHYFDSKEEAFDAVLNEIVAERKDILVFEEAAKKGGVAGLEIICKAIPNILKKETSKISLNIGKVLYDFHNQYESESLSQFKNGRFDSFACLIKLIKQGQKEGGVIAGDPAEIALAFSDAVVAAINRLSSFKRSDKKAPSWDVYMGMLLKRPL